MPVGMKANNWKLVGSNCDDYPQYRQVQATSGRASIIA